MLLAAAAHLMEVQVAKNKDTMVMRLAALAVNNAPCVAQAVQNSTT
jgi:hypothetical protein